jgi:hypothetical protein
MSATLARVGDGHGGGMAMQFTRVVSPVEDMEIWNASSDGFSFVISYESRSGPGFQKIWLIDAGGRQMVPQILVARDPAIASGLLLDHLDRRAVELLRLHLDDVGTGRAVS